MLSSRTIRPRTTSARSPPPITSPSTCALGDHQAARELNEDTLARYCRVLGEDHPRTLLSASNLAVDLRALGETEDRPG